jgi:hypothetical protein
LPSPAPQHISAAAAIAQHGLGFWKPCARGTAAAATAAARRAGVATGIVRRPSTDRPGSVRITITVIKIDRAMALGQGQIIQPTDHKFVADFNPSAFPVHKYQVLINDSKMKPFRVSASLS